MSTSGTPRPRQVELLTRGVTLPLPALEDLHLLIITGTLARIWHDLARTITDFSDQHERDITAMMESQLNRSSPEDARWTTLVGSVVRGNEMLDFDGSALENRPDLSIRLTHRNPAFPLIVECKVIDPATEKRVWHYGHHGIARFVEGRYAWYAREAIMLAYVRDGSTIESCLLPYLEQQMQEDSNSYLTHQLPEQDARVSYDLARSIHGRSYRYPLQQPDEPGPISLWHIWLQPHT